MAKFQTLQRMLHSEHTNVVNHLISIQHDSNRVDELSSILNDNILVFANLRNGLWYCKNKEYDSCCFKSTDGHDGQWHFSLNRLNLNVAKTVTSNCNKMITIVDSTRSCKLFPDSMNSTVRYRE